MLKRVKQTESVWNWSSGKRETKNRVNSRHLFNPKETLCLQFISLPISLNFFSFLSWNSSLDLWVYFKICQKFYFEIFAMKYFRISHFKLLIGGRAGKEEKHRYFQDILTVRKLKRGTVFQMHTQFQVSHSSSSFSFFFSFWETYSLLNAKVLSTTVYVSSQSLLPSPIPAAFEEFPRSFTFSSPFPQSTGMFLLPPVE